MPDLEVADRDRLGEELAGLDALELADRNRPSLARRVWTRDLAEVGCHRASRSGSGSSWCGRAGGPSTSCPARPRCSPSCRTNWPTGGCSGRCG